jgi:hypothetical protein
LFEAWATVWLSGYFPHGSWFSWVREWFLHAQRHPDQVLWMQYEDVLSNPTTQVQRIASFLGLDSESPETNEIIAKVVEASSFDSMKQQADRRGGESTPHLRKGVSGDWKSHFSQELLKEFTDKFHQECDGIPGLRYSLGSGEPDLVSI